MSTQQATTFKQTVHYTLNGDETTTGLALAKMMLVPDLYKCVTAHFVLYEVPLWSRDILNVGDTLQHFQKHRMGATMNMGSVLSMLGGSLPLYPSMFDEVCNLFPEDWRPQDTKITTGDGTFQIAFIGSMSKDGPQRDILFKSGPDFGFPYSISCYEYADMNEEAGHTDSCPVYHPEHEPDCPVWQLMESGGGTDSQYEEAQSRCECGADDCNCFTDVVRTAQGEFTSNESTNDMGKFLSDFLYGVETVATEGELA